MNGVCGYMLGCYPCRVGMRLDDSLPENSKFAWEIDNVMLLRIGESCYGQRFES